MLYGRAWHEIAERWDAMQINTNRVMEFNRIAKYAFANRQQYIAIEENTGVPWAMVACIHRRESDAQDHGGNPLFTCYLGNGQPFNKVTTIVPKGRGPFDSFEEGCIDALQYDHLNRVVDWRIEKQLYYLEAFNGFGYRNHGVPSAYIWGGTNIQEPGKFTSDGHWDGTHIDQQPGCAPMLYSIMKLDPSIECTRED